MLELVIKIPEETYEYWKEHKYEYVLSEAIANGVLLPKEYRRIVVDTNIVKDFKNKIKHYEKDYKFTQEEILNILERYEIKYTSTIIKTDEEKDNKMIHVGDEIYSELTDSKAVVQHIDCWNRYECFTDNGSQFIISTETFNDYWVKTGKNYPQIIEILKQMKEG